MRVRAELVVNSFGAGPDAILATADIADQWLESLNTGGSLIQVLARSDAFAGVALEHDDQRVVIDLTDNVNLRLELRMVAVRG